MRTAIVHYWLLNMRGGEKVVEALCRLLPEADIFTLFVDEARLTPAIRAHRITASCLQPLRRHYRSLLPLMPMALEQFDLREYDLVVSSESGPAKGVLTSSHARHVCYCHTPMRYLWDLYPAYRSEWTTGWARLLMPPLAHYLRLWDYASASRVDDFVANSANVQSRIRKIYRRPSEVIHPPVAIGTFYWRPAEDYDLIVSALVPYKRVADAVRAYAENGRKLKIVGEGPEFRNLRRIASANIEFCGHVPEDQLRDLYAHCRAFLMPAEEDFGIAAVEALASGKPVIALGRGGARETVPAADPLGGLLYSQPSPQSLNQALRQWDRIQHRADPRALQHHASRFSEAEFARKMQRVFFGPQQFDEEPLLRAPAALAASR